MNNVNAWKDLGHRHLVWELLRFYLHLRGDKLQREWLGEIRNQELIKAGTQQFRLDIKTLDLLFDYIGHRSHHIEESLAKLRTEEDAIAYCRKNGIAVGKTATKNKDHHQASKALVAAVSLSALSACKQRGTSVDVNPQKRCAWLTDNGLHVTSRNLDGAIPSTMNPTVIWEIKEYWGKTAGGSKMSDAVYECNLVGRELRDFEQLTGKLACHIVFVDGKE